MPAVNELFTAKVRDIGSSGQGIVEHPDGMVFFVSGAWLEETATFRITQLKGRHGYARLEQLINKSPDRITPQCAHQGSGLQDCGGCPWQFIDYSAQLKSKQHRVESALKKLQPETIKTIWESTEIFSYRNRAQLKTDGQKLGFLAESSNALVDVTDCLVLNEKNRGLLRELRESLPKNEFRPGRKKPWVSIDIDDAMSIEDIKVNQRRPFRQANNAQNDRMRNWLAGHLSKLNKNMHVIELFCGSGNFTEIISASEFQNILAVEAVIEPLQTLDKKCLPNVKTLAANLFTKDSMLQVFKQSKKPQILVLDPPREGLKNKIDFFERGKSLQHIFYISCDLATFTRDVGVLGIFRLKKT